MKYRGSGRFRRLAVISVITAASMAVPAVGAMATNTGSLKGASVVQMQVDASGSKLTSFGESFDKVGESHRRFNEWHFYKAKKWYHRQANLFRPI